MLFMYEKSYLHKLFNSDIDLWVSVKFSGTMNGFFFSAQIYDEFSIEFEMRFQFLSVLSQTEMHPGKYYLD